MQSAGAYGILTALRQNPGSAIEYLGFDDVVVSIC